MHGLPCRHQPPGQSVRPRRRPPLSGDEAGSTGITQRELLLEMREDIRGLKAAVDAIARDQALGVERRAAMQRSADSIYDRLDGRAPSARFCQASIRSRSRSSCVCGRRLRNDGTFADGRHRKQHANPCEAWGRKARLGDETWEAPVLAQVAGIALDADTMASVVAALGSSRQPVAIDRARIDRQMRELALEHAAGNLGDEAYLARLKVLRQQRDAVAGVGRASATCEIPIEGRDEWIAAAARIRASPGARERGSRTRRGRRRSSPRSLGSRSMTGRSQAASRPSTRAHGRSRSTVDGSSVRCGSWRSTTSGVG